MSTSTLGLFWSVSYTNKYKGSPTAQRTRNDLDAHGVFLDLPRLDGEEDVSYWKRLQSVIPLRAGAHQEGLVHGITRELGLEEKIGIKITPVFATDRWLAPSPHVEINSTSVVLYSEYYGVDDPDNVIDATIEIFDHGDGYLLSGLVTEVNSSAYFLAELGAYADGTERSSGLIPRSSVGVVAGELVPPTTRFLLVQPDVVPYSVSFSEKDIFEFENSREISDNQVNGLSLCWSVENSVGKEGEYTINYKTGTVTSYSTPSGNGSIRYEYRDFPCYVRWSLITVYSLRDPNYRTKLFEEETSVVGETLDGLVTAEGAAVYSQIFSKSPCMWGK